MKVNGLSNSLSEECVCDDLSVFVSEWRGARAIGVGWGADAGKLNHPVSKRT